MEQATRPGSAPGSPTLQGILKRHPADTAHRDNRIASPIEGDFSAFTLSGDGPAAVPDDTSSGRQSSGGAPTLRIDTSGTTGSSASEVTTLVGDDRSAAAASDRRRSNTFQRRVGFNTFTSGQALEGRATVTGGGTGAFRACLLTCPRSELTSLRRSLRCRLFVYAVGQVGRVQAEPLEPDLPRCDRPERWVLSGSLSQISSVDLTLPTEYSVNATDWLLNYFLEDSDEVVVLRVIEPSSSAQTAGFESITREARSEAERVLDYLMKKNGDERQVRAWSARVWVAGSCGAPLLTRSGSRRSRSSSNSLSDRSRKRFTGALRASWLPSDPGLTLDPPPQHDRDLQAGLAHRRHTRSTRLALQVGVHGFHIPVRSVDISSRPRLVRTLTPPPAPRIGGPSRVLRSQSWSSARTTRCEKALSADSATPSAAAPTSRS